MWEPCPQVSRLPLCIPCSPCWLHSGSLWPLCCQWRSWRPPPSYLLHHAVAAVYNRHRRAPQPGKHKFQQMDIMLNSHLKREQKLILSYICTDWMPLLIYRKHQIHISCGVTEAFSAAQEQWNRPRTQHWHSVTMEICHDEGVSKHLPIYTFSTH